MTWTETKSVLARLGYYFDTEEEYQNFMSFEVDYPDEKRIKKEMCKHL